MQTAAECTGSGDGQTSLGEGRVRLGIALLSCAVIGFELALMRTLALRWWQHLAYMVISVALLGFGASGAALALAQRLTRRADANLAAFSLLFAAAMLLARWACGHVPLDVQYLAWDARQAGNVLLLELALAVPFFLAGLALGLTLMTAPERIGGRYAASLIGSAAGGIAAVVLMLAWPADGVHLAMAGMAVLAGVAFWPWQRSVAPFLAAAAALGASVWLAAALPGQTVSEYKLLWQARAMPEVRVIHHAEGPLGRIDALSGPALHYAPGLSLRYAGRVPPHVLLLADGDAASAVYDCARREEWAFLDYTTKALPYHLRARPAVLVIGAGGGSDIGLAHFHQAVHTTALEINPAIIAAMNGPLAAMGGRIYGAPGVRVVQQEARGFLASTPRTFDVIQLPELDAFGASGAGLYATQEAYLYTVEALEAMFARLTTGGVLCVTRWARTPPRDGLRIFDTAAQMLRRRGLDPAAHLAMVRSWVTASVLVFRQPLGEADSAGLRAFCEQRAFDLCWLPGVHAEETNRFHILERPYYYEGARALLGPEREAFLAQYPFRIEATTDDCPYFFQFFRWHSLPLLREQLGARARAYLEAGYLMLIAALVQAVVLSALLIVAPLAPKAGQLRAARGKAAAFTYFVLIGAGFMFLEMSFLQKLILYLAHPMYAAAAVIASFLLCSGLGSLASSRWTSTRASVGARAGAAAAALALLLLLLMDPWLSLSQAAPLWLRFLLAGATIAPLAFAMGHLFPAGLAAVSARAPELVPWAWAVNGVASVVATVAAPLLAMHFGFRWLILLAALCYAAASAVARRCGGA